MVDDFMRDSWAAFLLASAAVACSSRDLPAVVERSEPWCQRNTTERTLYCRDFDDDREYYEGWSSTYVRPDRLGSLSTREPVSPDGSRYLEFATPELGAEPVQDQLHYLTPIDAEIVLRFDARVGNFDPNAIDLTLASIYPGTDTRWKLGLDLVQGWIQLSESHAELDGNPGSFVVHQAVRPDLEQWRTFALSLAQQAGEWQLSLALGGEPWIGPVSVSPFETPRSIKATIGVDILHGPARPMTVAFDNIMFSDTAAP